MSDIAARIEAPSAPAVNHVAAYLCVSTGRQAENDLSIPDQRRQIEQYCASRGWAAVEAYVEPGSSATDDRRPAFQAMIDAALAKRLHSPRSSSIASHASSATSSSSSFMRAS